jgi:hypothetical protein
VRPPVLEDLLDHVALLVDLDRVHGGVAARVLELGRGGAEALGQLLDARPEDVAEAQQHGERDALLLEVAREVEQAQLALGVLAVGPHDDVAARVDVEVARAPALDVVQRAGVVHRPRRGGGRGGGGVGRVVLDVGRDRVDAGCHARQT